MELVRVTITTFSENVQNNIKSACPQCPMPDALLFVVQTIRKIESSVQQTTTPPPQSPSVIPQAQASKINILIVTQNKFKNGFSAINHAPKRH